MGGTGLTAMCRTLRSLETPSPSTLLANPLSPIAPYCLWLPEACFGVEESKEAP